jgi:hypothetical protein
VEPPCPSRRRPFSAVVKPRLETAGARLRECVSEATALTRNVKFHASAILRRQEIFDCLVLKALPPIV